MHIVNLNIRARKPNRLLLVRDGDFYFHVYQLAEFLNKSGHHVEILNTFNGEIEPLYRTLVQKTQALNIKCHFINNNRAAWIERKAISSAYRGRLIDKLAVVTPYKLRKAYDALKSSEKFDAIITFDPSSLFLACKVFPGNLNNIIHYSLEISDESHLDFQESRTVRAFRYYERAALSKIRALMIQDRFRAKILLKNASNAKDVKTILFPVAMSGPAVRKASVTEGNFRQVKILFFGGLWSRHLLSQLETLSLQLKENQVMVIQGGRSSIRVTETRQKKFIISTEAIPFDQVNDYISSADIGLAIYPNSEANSRYTAFSSEKIARYVQCGVPFIAFRNEAFEFLQAETGCCELIDNYAEIPDAIGKIVGNYGVYQRGAYEAFDTFFCLDQTGLGLLREIEGLDWGSSS